MVGTKTHRPLLLVITPTRYSWGMVDRKMHIAKTGNNVGKWVECSATILACPNGGTHTSSKLLKETKKWVGRKSLTDVTKTEYTNYMKHVLTQPTTEQPLTEDEKTKQYAKRHEVGNVSTAEVTLRFNKAQWRAFLNDTYMNDIDFPLDLIKKVGQTLNTQQTIQLKNVPLRGKPDNIQKIVNKYT